MPIAVVGHGQDAVVLADRDTDAEWRPVGDQGWIGDGLVAELLAGVGRVRDQFAQEDLALGVDGMDHQIEQAGDIRLEHVGAWRRGPAVGFGLDRRHSAPRKS